MNWKRLFFDAIKMKRNEKNFAITFFGYLPWIFLIVIYEIKALILTPNVRETLFSNLEWQAWAAKHSWEN